MDKRRIEEEAAQFFEWPDPKHRNTVTLTSCVIFAATIAEMARAEERDRWEAAGAQCRFRQDAEWSACTLDHARMVQQRPDEWAGYEVRILYAERGA